WVSREAVFFDTSGQFTLHDAAHQGSAQLWEHFLELLFKEKKSPIQGIILILSLERLALQSKEEQSWHFQNICERLEELKAKQTYTAPIYLLLTKADCLAGFSEYFDDLSPEEREQPWGLSFNEDELSSAQTLLDTFTLKFNSLIQNLNDRLITRLHSERDWHRRASIKDFPLQVESLKKTLSYFLHKQLDNFTTLSTFVLRGIYFTSAIPEEHIIDRLLKPLSQTFSLTHYTRPLLTPQRQAKEPFFIKNLFRKVILADQRVFNLQKNLTLFKRQLWQRRTLLTAIAASVVGTFFYWGYHISQNINNVAVAEKAITRYQFLTTDVPKNLSPQQSFAALASLFSMQNALDKTRLPKLLQWASHRPDLSSQQKIALSNGLQKILSWQLEQILEQELARKTPSSTTIYGVLKTYQAINSPQQFEKNTAQNWLTHYWQDTFHPSMTELRAIEAQLKNLPALPKVSLPAALLKQAYANLAQQPPEKLINAMMNNDFALRHPPLIIQLPTSNTLFQFKLNADNYSIPPQFTKENFMAVYDHELPMALTQLQKGQSILKSYSPEMLNQDDLLQKARDEYMTQYITTWQMVPQSMRLDDSADLTKIQATLEQMVDPHSTLSTFLQTIQNNTKVLYQGMPTPISLAFDNTTLAPANTLDKEWYHDLTRLNHLVSSVNTAAHPQEKAFSLAQYRMTHMSEIDIFSDLQDKAIAVPPSWQAWSQQLSVQTWQGLLQQSQDYIASAWNDRIWPAYNSHIARRFPIDANAKESIALNDFEAFFAPKGTFNLFLTQYLDPFIDKANPTQWEAKTRDGAGIDLSEETLQALRQTDLVTQLFFKGKPHLADVQLAFVPTLPKNIKTVAVKVDDTLTVYDQQKAKPVTLMWPNGSHQVSLTITTNGGEAHTLNADGLWAWVQLVDQGELKTTTTPTEIIFNLPIQGTDKIQYTLASLTTPINPFVPGVLQGAVLPESIG
ncbi:MAG: hypothetical protein K2P98_06590, partial [Neisseriaceae bacterium]|nr:hypothetical protein [Neisseriaceae bacterium]